MANGELLEQRAGPEGDTWVWEQREPMATYLVQMLTGDYEVLDHGVVGTVPIVDVALADDVEQMAPYFDLTDDQMAYFEPLFGPYPLDRYGLAFTDSFSGLAMETQGRSLFSRDDFPGGSPGVMRAPAAVARAGPPVVRQRRHARRLVRSVAQRVLRHLRPVAVARPRRRVPARDAGEEQPGVPPGLRRVDRRAHGREPVRLRALRRRGRRAARAAAGDRRRGLLHAVAALGCRQRRDLEARPRTSPRSPPRSPGATSPRSSTPGCSPRTSRTSIRADRAACETSIRRPVDRRSSAR